MKYTQHPLSAAFPAMSADDLASLSADIAAHGQREPGVLYEGQVLDGWHRYQACEAAGVEFVAVEFIDADPVAFVISRNAHRRHLTASQRAAAVVMCAEWAKPHRPKKGEPGSSFSTNEELAEAAGTTVRTVQQAKRAVESGLGEAVRDGMMSTKAAVAVAKGQAPKAKAQTEKERIAEEAFGDVDILDEMEQSIRERDAKIAALEADDTKAELARQINIAQHYQREIGVEQDKNVAMRRELDALRKWQTSILTATGAENPRAALAAIRAAFAKAVA